MISELESHRLVVMLVPLNPRLRNYSPGGCKRVCLDKNPKWYSEFCKAHPSSRKRNKRKYDTRIKRRNVLDLLKRLCSGKSSVSKYAAELMQIAQKMAA